MKLALFFAEQQPGVEGFLSWPGPLKTSPRSVQASSGAYSSTVARMSGGGKVSQIPPAPRLGHGEGTYPPKRHFEARTGPR